MIAAEQRLWDAEDLRLEKGNDRRGFPTGAASTAAVLVRMPTYVSLVRSWPYTTGYVLTEVRPRPFKPLRRQPGREPARNVDPPSFDPSHAAGKNPTLIA